MYSISKYSLFYLLYSQHPHFFSNNNPFQPLKVVEIIIAEYEKQIVDLQILNQLLIKTYLKWLLKLKRYTKKESKK